MTRLIFKDYDSDFESYSLDGKLDQKFSVVLCYF